MALVRLPPSSYPSFLHMIPSSSGTAWVKREKEWRSDSSSSLSLLFPLSAPFISVPPLYHLPLFIPSLARLRFFSPPCLLFSPISPLIFPVLLFPWILRCHLHALRLSSPISFSWLACLVCHTGAHIHAACTRSHAQELTHTHLCRLPSVPQVITSQTHPHKHRINPGFELAEENAQGHKNTSRLHSRGRPVEFDMLLCTRWVWGMVPADK